MLFLHRITQTDCEGMPDDMMRIHAYGNTAEQITYEWCIKKIEDAEQLQDAKNTQ